MKQFGKRCAILVLIAILLTSAFSEALAEPNPPRGIGFGNSWVNGAEKQIRVSNNGSKPEKAKKQEKSESKEDSREKEKAKPSKNQSKPHKWKSAEAGVPGTDLPGAQGLEANSSKNQPKQPKQPEMKPAQPLKPWEALEPQEPSENQPKLLDQPEQKPYVPSGDLQDTETIKLPKGRSWQRTEATKKSDAPKLIPWGTRLIPVVITSYEDSVAGSKFPIVRNTKIGSKLSELFRKISFEQPDDGAHGLTSVTIPASVFDRLDDESTLPLIRRVGIQTLADQMNRVIIQMGAIEEESAKDGLEYWLLRHSAADQLLTAEPLPLVLSEEGRCAFVKSWPDGISLVDFSRFVPKRLEKGITENGLRNPRLCEVVYDQLLTAEPLPLVLPEEGIHLIDKSGSNSLFFVESKPIMPLPKFGETYGNAEDRFRLIEIVNNELKENGAGPLCAYNLLSGGKKVVILNTDALRVMNGVPKSDTGYQHAFRVLFSLIEDGVPASNRAYALPLFPNMLNPKNMPIIIKDAKR